jgi:nuclear pore complex protein Nup54
MTEAERELAARLRRLQGALNRSATSLPRRVDALAATHRAEQASDHAAGAGAHAESQTHGAHVVGSAFASEGGGGGAGTHGVMSQHVNSGGGGHGENQGLRL